jgi:hypothetical protein
MEIQVKNPQGEVEAAKDADLPSLVSKGYQIPDQEYEFQDDEGKKLAVPASDFKKAIDTGWKFRDSATKKDEELEKKYGDSSVKALLYGAARGATLGLSDIALEKTGIASEEELKETQDRNAVASVIGDVTGTIVPAILSGGTGLVAKVAAKTPAALASRVALKVGEKAATKLAAKSATAQAIGKAATAAATEGFLVGEGQLISEASLGDAEFNAESLMAYGGTGAILGGGLGALGQVGLDAFKKSAKSAREYLKSTINKMDDKQAANAMLEKLGLEEKVADALEKINPDNEALQAYKTLGVNVPEYVVSQDPAMQQLGGYLQKQGNTLGGRLAQKEIGKTYEQLETIGNAFLKDSASVAESDLGGVAKKALLAKLDEETALARAIYDEFEEIGADIPLTDRRKKLFATRTSELPMSKLFKNEAASYVELFNTMENVKDLKRLRTIVGNDLKKSVRDGDANRTEFLDDLYKTLTRERDGAIEENFVGKPFISKASQIDNVKETIKLADELYSKANKQFSYLEKIVGKKAKSISSYKRLLEEVTDEKLAKNLFNLKDLDTLNKFKNDFPEVYNTARAKFLGEIKDKAVSNGKFSPLNFVKQFNKMDEKQLGFIFSGVKNPKTILEALEKAARALPKDINPSGTSTALFMSEMLNPTAYVAKQVSDMGAYLLWSRGEKGVLKYIKDTALPLANIEKAAQRVGQKVNSSAKGFLDSTGRLARTSSVKAFTPSETQLDRARNVYEQVQSQPEELQQRLEKNNRALTVAAPNTNSAYQTRVLAGVNFLASKIPRRSEVYAADNYKPSQSQVLMFHEYLAGVEQPFKVFEQMKNGYASPRSVEAIKVVYPKLFAQFQQAVLEGLSKKKTLTNFQRNRIQEIIGVKLSPAQDQDILMILQAPNPLQMQDQQGQAPRKIAKGKDFGNARRSMSSIDRVAYRE